MLHALYQDYVSIEKAPEFSNVQKREALFAFTEYARRTGYIDLREAIEIAERAHVNYRFLLNARAQGKNNVKLKKAA